ncbi:hypothetical protein A2U01_0064482, partial [Trifolium medium]|nr:hypothetical protein [Trifolium medium]
MSVATARGVSDETLSVATAPALRGFSRSGPTTLCGE